MNYHCVEVLVKQMNFIKTLNQLIFPLSKSVKECIFMVDLRHWITIRESSKHQNVHSTTSYFLLCFWFLDSYYFWQRITEKYSSRFLKVRRHSLLIEFFTLVRMLCQNIPFGEPGRRWETGRLLDFMYDVSEVLKISQFYFF